MTEGTTPRTQQLAAGKVLVDEPGARVVRIRIANPEKRGALDHEILDSLTEVVQSTDARCLVIAGDGPVFSAGYDIGNFNDESAFANAAEKLVAHPFTDAIEALEGFRFPVIAALNGHAIGGGLELAVTCDMRVAARGVKMGMPPAKIGLIYSHTGLRRFIDVCGVANTNELFFTGRNVDADRAYQMGLVNQVVEPDELEQTVLSLAREIAANSPLSLEGNKRILRTLRAMPGPLPEDVEAELVDLRESCFHTEDFREGIRAFGEKRAPQWKGR
jgi:enoyl-CoA hydratase/carnithine racemase